MRTLEALTAPQPVVRKVLEKDVQSQCVDWARAHGYWARKFSSMTQRSVPDYLFSRAQTGRFRAVKFACEFKRPGKTSTASQLDEQKAMRDTGWKVFECDDFEAFKQAVMEYEEANRVFG